MKRMLSFILCFVLAVSLALPASAFTAKLSSQALSVDGIAVDCEKYNIDGSNYFKLRDLAALLDGTGSQFDVGYDSAKKLITITTDHAYTTPNGTELVVGQDQSPRTKVSPQTIMIDGVERSDLKAYNIGGNNFFQLRQMGEALGFDVDYDTTTRTMLVTSKELNDPVTVSLGIVSYTMKIGDTLQLQADVTPEGTPVTWSSGNTKIAEVDQNGLVTALSLGRVDITAGVGRQKAFCTLTVIAPEEIVMYSPENFVERIPYAQMQKYLEQYYSVRPHNLSNGMRFGIVSEEATNPYKSLNQATWTKNGPVLFFHSTSSSAAMDRELEHQVFFDKPRIQTVFFSYHSDSVYENAINYGLYEYGYGLDIPITVTRVEIADTVESIDFYAFGTCALTRLGIPASVKRIGGYYNDAFGGIGSSLSRNREMGYNDNVVIYGEPDSYAETYAKKNNIPFVEASILYGTELQTVMVTPEERELYLQYGWYEEPVKMLYAPDRRTKVVPLKEMDANVAQGWYTQAVTTLYAPDDKTLVVALNEVEDSLNQGWYEVPVTYVYSPDEAGKVVPKNEINDYIADGWYSYPVTRLYAVDGRTKVVASKDVESNLSVGWYKEPVTIIYSPDGLSMVIPIDEVELYTNAQDKLQRWYTYPVITLYAPDGRITVVASDSAEEYISVGWYRYPVTTLYAADGRTTVVALDNVETYLSVGWYKDRSAVYTTLYALDGRTKEVLKIHVAEEEAVGWYTYEHYLCALVDQKLKSEGNNSAIELIEYLMGLETVDSKPYNALVEKKDEIYRKWREETECPVVILSYYVDPSGDTPEVHVRFRNLTKASTRRIDLMWTCLDAYWRPTVDNKQNSSTVNAYYTGTIYAEDTCWVSWKLKNNKETMSITDCTMTGVSLSDGTVWFLG